MATVTTLASVQAFAKLGAVARNVARRITRATLMGVVPTVHGMVSAVHVATAGQAHPQNAHAADRAKAAHGAKTELRATRFSQVHTVGAGKPLVR
jgi:hypothetical protein